MRHDTFKTGVKLKYKTKTTERKPCNNVLLLRFLRNEYPVSRWKKKTNNMQMPEEKYTISVCFFELLMH